MKNEMSLMAESVKMKAIGILGDNSLLIRAESSGETVFVSGGRWLHPLLDCIEAIETGELSGETITSDGGICIYDRVSGKAAALLVARIAELISPAPVSLHSALASEPALGYLSATGISVRADEVIPRIACATEKDYLLEENPSRAELSLRRRAGRGVPE
jgi:hypothetical protein